MGMAAAVIGAGVLGAGASIATGAMNAGAAKDASNAQVNEANKSLALQQQEFQQTQANLSPYMQAGQGALGQYQALLGMGQPNYGAYVQGNPDLLAAYNAKGEGQGMDQWGQQHWQQFGQNEGRQVTPFSGAQQTAIDALKSNPLYTSLINQGNQAILANASATGGLRSGNTSANLANFDANTLAQVYQSQLGNLGNLVNLGQNSAAGVGQFGANYANSAANVMGQLGSAQAGGILGGAGALGAGINGGFSDLLKGLSTAQSYGGFGGSTGLGVIDTPSTLGYTSGALDGLF